MRAAAKAADEKEKSIRAAAKAAQKAAQKEIAEVKKKRGAQFGNTNACKKDRGRDNDSGDY
jgi:hypothetical protein